MLTMPKSLFDLTVWSLKETRGDALPPAQPSRESPCPIASYIAACAYGEPNPTRRECLLTIVTAAAIFYWPDPVDSARRG